MSMQVTNNEIARNYNNYTDTKAEEKKDVQPTPNETEANNSSSIQQPEDGFSGYPSQDSQTPAPQGNRQGLKRNLFNQEDAFQGNGHVTNLSSVNNRSNQVKNENPATASMPGTNINEDDKNINIRLSDGRSISVPKDDGLGNPVTSVAKRDPQTGKLKMILPQGQLTKKLDEGLRLFLKSANTEVDKRRQELEKLKSDGAPGWKIKNAKSQLENAQNVLKFGVRWHLDAAATHLVPGHKGVFTPYSNIGADPETFKGMSRMMALQSSDTVRKIQRSPEMYQGMGGSPFKTNPHIKRPK